MATTCHAFRDNKGAVSSIRHTYLAKSGSGRIVATFDSPDKLRAFIADRARQNVRLTAWEETVVCRPLAGRAAAPAKRLRAVGEGR